MALSHTVVLYHYTTTAGADSIRLSGVIYPGNSVEPYGGGGEGGAQGVVLSSLSPDQYYRHEIVDRIHGPLATTSAAAQGGRHNSADWLVEVYVQTLDPNRLIPIKPDVYLYCGGPITVTANQVKDKPRCLRGGANGGRGGGQPSAPQGSPQQQQQWYQPVLQQLQTVGTNLLNNWIRQQLPQPPQQQQPPAPVAPQQQASTVYNTHPSPIYPYQNLPGPIYSAPPNRFPYNNTTTTMPTSSSTQMPSSHPGAYHQSNNFQHQPSSQYQ
ncbi:uncharacterized protein LOC128952277 isoform X2 [Oppia nitens]|nr:uncharacterized protein LOC128952277 isoform X2 [Oppia nitens]